MIHLPVVQGSAEWVEARLGLPTASEFHRVLTPKKMELAKAVFGYRDELLAEWILGYPVINAESGFMQRGTQMEADARSWYELQTDTEVMPAGFCLTDDRRAGCSPDGFVGDEGLIEIKCPDLPKHIGFLLDGVGDDYRPQAQGQLMITCRDWVDLVVYGPAAPPIITRVTRDEEFIGKLRPALTQLCEMLDQAKRILVARGVKPKLGMPPARGLVMVA